MVRPTPAADRVEPTNALTSVTAEGRGSLWVDYRIRPEGWNRAVNMTITASVYRNSDDIAPVAGLDATPIPVNAVPQGTALGPVELAFPGLDGDDEGAFARKNTSATGIGFKNGRVRVSVQLTAAGTIPGSLATGLDTIGYETELDIVLVKDSRPPAVLTLFNKS